jgi:hypothetical protein
MPPVLNILTRFVASGFNNMNGDVYGISNPNYTDPVSFPTTYSQINSETEFFEVYSPEITSKYAMVYWTMMPPVPLPKNIVSRFDNKKIAIVGYEVDQVFTDTNGVDSSVPITWAYNHHYEAYLRNGENSFEKIGENKFNSNDLGQYNHGARKIFKLGNGTGTSDNLSNELFNDNALYFSEGNGGEFRASFHGYPNGYAQLLNSPKYFNIQPMQIDTRNRNPKYINDTNFHPGIMPMNSAAPENAQYSGLLECPCTTRIKKTIHYNYQYRIFGGCGGTNRISQEECQKLSPYNITPRIVSNNNIPRDCSFINGINYYNTYNSTASCGNNSTSTGYTSFYATFNDTTTNVSSSIYYNKLTDIVEISLFGPSEVWYGVAFGATSMADEPYTIVVEGTSAGNSVFEQKLGNHAPGVRLKKTISIISNELEGNTRKVVVSRRGYLNSQDYFNFTSVSTDINTMSAVGSSASFSYHKSKSTEIMRINGINDYTCVCNDGKIGKINGIRFHKNCMPEPRGDLVRQKNPTCNIETYQGGQSCCHHKWILLDENQTQPEGDMTYRLKFRFYFQNYTTQKRMVRAYYQTEAYSGEYDVPKCLPGTPPEECIHSITARWQVKDMVDHRYIGNSKGFELIYAGPHCHAPMCIDVELYNSDTGDLICHVDSIRGKGNSSVGYDEKDYIKLNPCLWGQDRGLLKPQFLRWDTNLTSIKRCNSTNLHYGEMASWQMRGIVIE